MKQLFLTMTPRVMPGRAGASSLRGLLRPLMSVLLLLLGWGSAAPTNAEGGIISTARTGTITVRSGETLTIIDGGSVTDPANHSGSAVIVEQGGTLNIDGGSVSASTFGYYALVVLGGTLNISAGSVSDPDLAAVYVSSGSLNMTGGTVTSGNYAIACSGTATIPGTASVSAVPGASSRRAR